jgi:large subunit ribosomal protein L9
MKVLLIKDVYKLGRAGDVKKVANGYGRNYLLPQGLAVLATPGALKQIDRIREHAEIKRAIENKELSGLADLLSGMVLEFPVKAGETGKLYGSVTTQMIANAINEKLGVDIDRHQIDTQPIRMLGVHKINVRLTIDLIPELTALVYREGESPKSALTFVEGEVTPEELGLIDEETAVEEVVSEAEDISEADNVEETAVESADNEMVADEDAEVETTEIEEEVEEDTTNETE